MPSIENGPYESRRDLGERKIPKTQSELQISRVTITDLLAATMAMASASLFFGRLMRCGHATDSNADQSSSLGRSQKQRAIGGIFDHEQGGLHRRNDRHDRQPVPDAET